MRRRILPRKVKINSRASVVRGYNISGNVSHLSAAKLAAGIIRFEMHQSLFAVPLLLATSLVAAHGGVIGYTIDGKRYST
jgi:hypothetical protein